MKFKMVSTSSYNSIHPAYQYTEQFDNNYQQYQEGTKWFGILLAFLSGTFFTISSALIKVIHNVHPMVLLMIRSTVQILTLSIVTCAKSKNVFGPRGQRLLIQFQGLVGGMTLSFLYFSFRKLPLGDAIAIIFSSPVIVIILSFFFLKEPCGILRMVVMFTLFTGVVLVARPPFIFQTQKSTYDVAGYVYALAATFFTALNIVIMRKCVDIHYSVMVLSLSTWSLIAAAFFYFIVPDDRRNNIVLPSDWGTWGLILLVAFTGLCGQVLVTKALKVEGAGKVSVTRSLDIILGYIIQVFFFGDIPTTTSIIGALLILATIVCMGFEKEIYGVCDFIP